MHLISFFLNPLYSQYFEDRPTACFRIVVKINNEHDGNDDGDDVITGRLLVSLFYYSCHSIQWLLKWLPTVPYIFVVQYGTAVLSIDKAK